MPETRPGTPPGDDDWLRAELDDSFPLPPLPPLPPERTPPPRPPAPQPARSESLLAEVDSAAPPSTPLPPSPFEAALDDPAEIEPESRPLPDWVIVLADGVSIPVYGPVVIGRNPSQERFPDASISAIADLTQTMSKTHARIFLRERRLYVDDLDSTNGVALFPSGNAHGALAVEPGVPAELRSGDVVQLGEYRLSIRRS